MSRLENGLISLRVGATLLTAQLDFKVKIGEKLALEVLTPGDKPILQSLRNDQLKQLIDAAIRQTLPKQHSIAQLAKDIETLIAQKQLTKLPANIQSALKQLIQAFPDKSSVSQAAGLKQAFQQSGLFLEARLSGIGKNHAVNLNHDIKAGLLRLQTVIQQQLIKSPATSTQTTHATSYKQALPGSPFAGAANPSALQNFVIRADQTFTLINNAGTRISLLQNPQNLSSQLQQKPLVNILPPNTPAGATTTTSTTDLRIILAQTNASPTAATQPSSLLAGRSLLATLKQPGMMAQPGLASPLRMLDPSAFFVYPGMPFRLQNDQQDTRPSARFSRLDSLTKILTMFLKEADASLARIQHSQLSQHHVETEQKQSWLFELPIKNREAIDVFQFRLEKDAQNKNENDDDENTGWTINIAFNIEPLGQMYSKVSIHQKKVSVIFWAEQQDVADNFLQHMQTLQQDLENAGLIVTHINCHQGKPPEGKNHLSGTGVVNEKA